MPNHSAHDGGKLFQARYVLTTLGIDTRFTARGDALKGEIAVADHGALTNPVTGEAFRHISFTVDQEGILGVDDPPALRGLSAGGGEFTSLGGLLDHLRGSLERRVEKISAICERLQRVGVDSAIDGERMVGVARLELDPEGTAVLEADGAGLTARYLIPALGDRSPISLGELAIDLENFGDRVDLELLLGARAEKVLSSRRRTAPTAARGKEIELSVEVPASPPDTSLAGQGAAAEDTSSPIQGAAQADPSRPPTLQQLTSRFGGAALLRPGFTVGSPLQIEGEEARFIAEHVKGDRFRAMLRTRARLLWEGDLELTKMGAVDDFVSAALGISEGAAAVADDLSPVEMGCEPALVAGLLPPVANEVWILEVQIDEDDGIEVRYRGLNVGGIAFGAPRVLPKAAFESSYITCANGYRMQVRITEVRDDVVSYQRLDANRDAVGGTRQSPMIVFLANFVAESAAY